jgi:hypothetical protein
MDKLSTPKAAINPMGRKNAQKASEAPAHISRAPIGATHGTSLAFDPLYYTPAEFFSEHDFSSQRARSSKEVTEADVFLCDLDPSLCALCVSTPLLWLRLRRARFFVAD